MACARYGSIAVAAATWPAGHLSVALHTVRQRLDFGADGHGRLSSICCGGHLEVADALQRQRQSFVFGSGSGSGSGSSSL
jgi:hypothetical protein